MRERKKRKNIKKKENGDGGRKKIRERKRRKRRKLEVGILEKRLTGESREKILLRLPGLKCKIMECRWWILKILLTVQLKAAVSKERKESRKNIHCYF